MVCTLTQQWHDYYGITDISLVGFSLALQEEHMHDIVNSASKELLIAWVTNLISFQNVALCFISSYS